MSHHGVHAWTRCQKALRFWGRHVVSSYSYLQPTTNEVGNSPMATRARRKSVDLTNWWSTCWYCWLWRTADMCMFCSLVSYLRHTWFLFGVIFIEFENQSWTGFFKFNSKWQAGTTWEQFTMAIPWDGQIFGFDSSFKSAFVDALLWTCLTETIRVHVKHQRWNCWSSTTSTVEC